MMEHHLEQNDRVDAFYNLAIDLDHYGLAHTSSTRRMAHVIFGDPSAFDLSRLPPDISPRQHEQVIGARAVLARHRTAWLASRQRSNATGESR
jgi:hypothetical protein